MTLGPIDAYLRQLERELRQRGLEDARIVEEAREHLVDAVEDGRRRGLSIDDAEREACERFGAPETVAAHVVTEGDHMMNRFAAVLDALWRRRWWILAPTVVTALVTSVMSHYLLPTRYQSESIIRVVSPRVPAEYMRPTAADRSGARFRRISQSVLSHTLLERIVSDFGLDHVEQERAPLSDVVLQMRSAIKINFLTSKRSQDNEVGEFHVSFVSADPNMAMKITERLASMIVTEHRRESETRVEANSQFIERQIADVRRRVIAYENTIEELRAQNRRRPLSQADVLQYEILQERYKELLAMAEEFRIAANLERSRLGVQFKVVDAARLPERPLGPSRLGVNVAGTFAGLGLGLVLVGVRGRSKKISG